MRAVITVIGKDMVGILAKVSDKCYKNNINILEVTQSVLQDLFAMIMMIDVESCTIPFNELGQQLDNLGKEMGLSVHLMHEDIFNSMHRI